MNHDTKNKDSLYRDDQGLLVREVTAVTDLDSGEVQEVHEKHRQEVPMRLEERVTRTLARIPIEEKTEMFGPDGSVSTNVKTLPERSLDSLDLRQGTSFDERDVSAAIQQLDHKLDRLLSCKGKHTKCKKSAKVGLDFGKRKKCHAESMEHGDESVGARTSFMSQADAKYASKYDDGEAEVSHDEPKEEATNATEQIVTAVGWVAFAVVGGLVFLALL